LSASAALYSARTHAPCPPADIPPASLPAPPPSSLANPAPPTAAPPRVPLLATVPSAPPIQNSSATPRASSPLVPRHSENAPPAIPLLVHSTVRNTPLPSALQSCAPTSLAASASADRSPLRFSL